MQVKREHLAGLELALAIADTVCTDSISVVQLEALIEQAKAASVEEYAAEAVEVVGYLFKLHSGVYSQMPGHEWEPLMTVAQHSQIMADAKADANLYRQWFNAVQDLNPKYLEAADYAAAARLEEQ